MLNPPPENGWRSRTVVDASTWRAVGNIFNMAKSTEFIFLGDLMKIIFLSNFFNHHQKSLARELNGKSEFCFVETEEMPEERKVLGYGEMEVPVYVTNVEKSGQELETDIKSCDVLIAGSAPERLLHERIKIGKLLFRYSERPIKQKKGAFLKILPRYVKWHWRNPKNKPVYLLCASAYTSYDYSKFGLFEGKTYKWGYFPEKKEYAPKALLAWKNSKRLLWCGRFIDWKHPDDAIKVAKMLKADGYSFVLDFIGTGEMKGKLQRMVEEYGLEDCVHFLGAMKPEQVRKEMENSGIFLFTSDYNEGWGAVLNEAMNSGCAVIASHAIGSVPYLINDNINGLVYYSGNLCSLYQKAKKLLDTPSKQEKLGLAAYETICTLWNAEIAAERLLNLSQHIIDGQEFPDLYEFGPCSKAEIVKDDWFYEE